MPTKLEDRASVSATDPNLAINDIAERFFEGVLEREPIFATILGDDRYDDRLPDPSAAVHVAVVVPTGKLDPEGGAHVVPATLQLSVALAA